MEKFDRLINSMTTEELCGQLLCYDLYDKDDETETAEILKNIHPGGIFTGTIMSEEKLKRYIKVVNDCTKVPVIVAGDIVDGPGNVIRNMDTFSTEMGRAASGDLELVKKAGELTAKCCRKYGYSWTFGPCVDISYNRHSPISNIGTVSDDPDTVIKFNSAFIDGLLENNYLMPALKHFPGEGRDDRNPHFVTTINDLSKEDWLNTYGKVYKTLIARGAPSIMVAHCALPAVENCDNPNDALPGTLSYNVMTKLLREELGFKGCIVSDAMSMIGAASRVPIEKLAVEYIKAGGDMILFPEPTDYQKLIDAVNSGEISMERLHDAVRHILILKDQARLFEDQQVIENQIDFSEREIHDTADIIAEKSIKFVRDRDNILPLSIPPHSKILMANILNPFFNKEPLGNEFEVMRNELEKRGFIVDYRDNIKHKEVKKIMNNYEVIFVNSNIHPGTYHGGTLRLGWSNMMTFWRAYILQHPRLIFISFGDPYKIYEFPYIKEYVNAFSNSPETQRAAVKVLLGEKPMTAKNPTTLKGFFEREI